MLDASIACSSAWFLVDSGKPRFHHLLRSVAESCGFRSSVRICYACFPFNAFMYMERLGEIKINN
jgi:hypothetical protein